MILLIYNYDSFTYNLAHLFGELGAEVNVVRNDAITIAEAEALAPDQLVISPGPGRPEDSGVSIPLIETFAGRIPILGVCLGHQAIVAVGVIAVCFVLWALAAGWLTRIGVSAPIFFVVLAIVAVGTLASIVAMGALSLVGFVPLIGLAVLPLQVAAWLFRALVFQFIELGAVGAYANRFHAVHRGATADTGEAGESARDLRETGWAER